VLVDGVDALARCLRHRLDEGALGVPVIEDVDLRVEVGGRVVVDERLRAADATVRINSLGMGMTAQSEGTERHLGEVDRDDLEVEEVSGCSGGAVLYRAAALRQVGVFDPRFFAYCEDLDLSWRLRRAGWRLVAVPASTVRHLMHGAGGPGNRFFFFAYFRNWLLMTLRNGDRDQIVRAVRNALGRTWISVRNARNPRQREVVGNWSRVWLGVAAGAPRTLAERSGRPVGATPTDDVVSRWMPEPVPAPPTPRPGGPTLVYLDVTSVLHTTADRHDVARLVADLPSRAPGIELVPVVDAASPSGHRRVTASEMGELLGQPLTRPHDVDLTALRLDVLAEPSVLIRPDELGAEGDELLDAAMAAIRAR
jgi:hypothetical protein